MSTFFDDVNNRITEELKARSILGVIVCVRDSKEGVLYLSAHKKPGAAHEADLNKDNLFLLASQSKTFTAVAALSLVEHGFLRLDGKLIDLLPGLKDDPDHIKLADITVKDLLQHRAPLDWSKKFYNRWHEGKPYPPVAQIGGRKFFTMLDVERLDKGPGKPQYSNAGYALLGTIIERVAIQNGLGSSFGDFVREHLLKPNGLNQIHPGLSDQEIAGASNMVQGFYMLKKGRRMRGQKPSLLACAPSGGFYGTAEQVSKFYDLLLTGKILTEESLEVMKLLSQAIWKQVPEGAGLRRYKNGSLGHDGVLPGYESRTVHKDGVTISIMSNLCTLSKAHNPTQRDKDKWLFPAIINIVRQEMAKRDPEYQCAPGRPTNGGGVAEGRKLAL